MVFQATPDFKGIKTYSLHGFHHSRLKFQATPDFKGIKTARHLTFAIVYCFRPPLISKGLRRLYLRQIGQLLIGFRPPLISKGLRRRLKRAAFAAYGFRPPLISKGLRLLGHVNSSHAFSFQATS